MTSPKIKIDLSMNIDEVTITVASNGYVISTEADSPDDVSIAGSFEQLTAWLFTHLTKPRGIVLTS
jgi:hypothetical protein